MFIQQSGQTLVGLIQDIPKKLLADMAIGQRLEAVVMKPAVAAEIAAIKVADSLLNIRTPESLQAGQRIQLELVLEQGKPVLKLISSGQMEAATKIQPSIVNVVKTGQQIAVEVVKILAANKLLVATTSQKTQQINVDVSQLSQQYKIGDKLMMDVVSVTPLAVKLRPTQAVAREQIIAERIQQLIGQQVDKPSLERILKAFNNQQIPEAVQREVRQLLHHSIDKAALTESQAFKQALVSSGTFTEKQLSSTPQAIQQDFKANVLKIIAALKTVIDSAGLSDEKTKALLSKLPAQVQAALASNGKTPAQLLSVLLSATERPSLINAALPGSTTAITNFEQAQSLTQLLSKTINRQLPITIAELQNMIKDVEGVHTKLQLNQLAMLKEPETANTVASWLFDVPIKDKQNLDLLQLKIDQHQQQTGSDDDDDIWSVQLRLDTQNLGPLQATITMHGEDVKIVFRAEQSQSAQLLTHYLPLLDKALAKLNITVSHIDCACGEVAKPILAEQFVNNINALVDISV